LRFPHNRWELRLRYFSGSTGEIGGVKSSATSVFAHIIPGELLIVTRSKFLICFLSFINKRRVQGLVKSVYFHDTEMGKIGIAENGEAIVNLLFPGEGVHDAVVQETDLLIEAGDQLRNYLEGKRKTFTIPLAPGGTEFMQRTWEQLRAIPYGETRSYGEIAERAGNRHASRAVGLACNRNPVPIFIPCHRVIGSNGNLTGYRGGLTVKAQLLDREQHGLL